MRILVIFAIGVALLAATTATRAASTVRLPPSMCPFSDAIFNDGFETAASIPHNPSNGSGGSFPGNVTRTVSVSGVGSRSYYLYLPAAYTPSRAWPLLLALRGAGGLGTNASAAQQVRSDWSSVADRGGFIVIAVAGEAADSGWGAPGDESDIHAALDDAMNAYNVEESRLYLWGFSAGGHYAHGLALYSDNPGQYGPGYFAAYGVSSGVLHEYACSDDGSFSPTCPELLAGVQPKIPVDIHIGTGDQYGLYPEAVGDVGRFGNFGWVSGQNLFFTAFAGGHLYTIAQLGQIWNNLCPFALGP